MNLFCYIWPLIWRLWPSKSQLTTNNQITYFLYSPLQSHQVLSKSFINFRKYRVRRPTEKALQHRGEKKSIPLSKNRLSKAIFDFVIVLRGLSAIFRPIIGSYNRLDVTAVLSKKATPVFCKTLLNGAMSWSINLGHTIVILKNIWFWKVEETICYFHSPYKQAILPQPGCEKRI